eukprot:7498295-Alexandrium_andersonii.AAC.1
MKKSHVPLKQFFEAYSNILVLIFDMADVTAIMNEQGSWNNVRSQLQCVAASSKTGHRIFGFALDKLVSEE